jgi:putative membrane protein
VGGRWGKLLTLCLGLVLFAWLLYHVGLQETLDQIRLVGWNFPPLLLPSLLTGLLFALGWWWTILPRPPLFDLFLIRTAGDAVNLITPLAYLGGEPLKAFLLQNHRVPLTDAFASVVVAKTIMTFAYGVFIFLGLATVLLGARGLDYTLAGGFGAGLFLALAAMLLYYTQRRGLFSILHRLIQRLGVKGEAWMAKREALENLDAKIATLYQDGRILSGCFLLSLLGWISSILETYFFLLALDTPVPLLTAFGIQALVVGVKALAFFIPASLGAQEGGTLLIFLGFGMSGGTAMAFSLLRRARELFWVLIGLLLLSRWGWGRGLKPEAFGGDS